MLAWVTGRSSDIGRVISEYLEIKGYDVFGVGSGQCDLTNKEEVELFVKNLDVPDVVVCCAGGNKVNGMRPENDNCLNMSHSDMMEIFNKNLFSVLHTCRSIVPMMNHGRIIFIGSNIVGYPRERGEIGMYAIAKSAIHEYTLHLARAMPHLNVNCIAPDGTTDPKEVAKTVEYLCDSKITGQIIRIYDDKPWVN